MKHSLKTLIDELLENKVISSEVAEDINTYYRNKHPDSSSSRMLGIFGVLGALLVGVGVILIVAHNWDELSRSTKSALSFIPVILGLFGCGYSLNKYSESFAWREGSAVFLTFAFGACIGLVSQIYNIPGSLKGYMLTWVLGILPLVYIMRSSVTSLLYIIGVVAYGCMAGFEDKTHLVDWVGHWLMLGAIIPYYIHLWNKQPNKNSTYYHHWMVPAAIAILLWTIINEEAWWLFTAYFSLFGCYYLWSSSPRFEQLSLPTNGYRIIGSLGMIGMLLTWSFYEWWSEISASSSDIISHIGSASFIATIILIATGGYLLIDKRKSQLLTIMDFAFLIFPLIFLLALVNPLIATILTNIFLLVMAVGTIYKGSKENHLGIVNYGLLIIAALIICRFFDVDIPFIIRGLLFIGVGAAFFFVNYQIIQNRKADLNK